MVNFRNSLMAAAVLFLLGVSAHPGHSIEEEIAERNAFFKGAKRDLSHCAAKLKQRGVEDRALKRRAAAVQDLRRKVALKKRQALEQKRKRQVATAMPSGFFPSSSGNGTSFNSTSFNGTGPGNGTGGGNGTGIEGASTSLSDYGAGVANASHLSSLQVTPDTYGVEEIIFSGNNSCILNPEGEVGPYYVLGELIRKDIREDQDGVPIVIDGQFIDVNTCDPIPRLYWDLWHCNATGVYAGVVANGNGNTADTANLNNTALRGIQETDSDGVASFESLFPGHYSGRTTHIHVVAHIGSSELSNGTITGGNITHTGQFFFDQSLIDEINANVSPYNTNTIAIVENADDRVFADETVTEGSDPVFNYVLLGDSVADGLFCWVTVGIDPNATYTASAAAVYGANGGVAESSSNSGPPS